MHKQHDISPLEWERCKAYFDYKCAYCGVEEETAKQEQGHHLHMEHAINDGLNDLSNCVPSCRYCNSKKWAYDYTDWYTKELNFYSADRLNKIDRWLNEDYKIYIRENL